MTSSISRLLATTSLMLLALRAPTFGAQQSKPPPTAANNGAVVVGLLAMSSFDPLKDSEYVLNVIEARDRVTIQLFRTDGRQKINAVLTRKVPSSDYVVAEVRVVPPMTPTASTAANCTRAFALAMLSFGKDAPGDGYRGIKLRGARDEGGNVFVAFIFPPFLPMYGFNYVLTPQGQVISSGHGY